MTKLNRIVCIDGRSIQKLNSAGIQTIESLLSRGSTGAGRKEIAKKSKISERVITKWVHYSDFFRIRGIAGLKSELLEGVGVRSMRDLAKADPGELYEAMLHYNNRKRLVLRVPGPVQLKRWVKTAQKIPLVVK